MRIRVEGTRPEITAALLRLRDVLIVGHVTGSRAVRRRGRYRVDVDAHHPTT